MKKSTIKRSNYKSQFILSKKLFEIHFFLFNKKTIRWNKDQAKERELRRNYKNIPQKYIKRKPYINVHVNMNNERYFE
ncbi:LOW QUALITY PROTEIN: hypothetical protein PFAG_00064 [Plasmodium falciparum Santa Lucia]|uniref:Uncharacterized protein n=3 Tax=Plasmodium falciparum TaxID=5833 RepID=A0A024WEY2_PLAFA|nr:LOW QUALITY PROTEIN: hypothetical protein PFTANZ_00088 [Plasmodium falciparum Tanzania (2000708)]ETW45564.1 LOW QUALITY PROTEIN: hypothetical protein PFNF135_00083 [Plasmodium falciparum NF135/5.C10]EUT94404.1 LOW QUALITY PROTEIN: hypothetical protein PFAG_00064 [Plasmodium falciparum Santa Lucia]